MTFTFRENFEKFDDIGFEGVNAEAGPKTGVKADVKANINANMNEVKTRILADKLTVPHFSGHISRPRLDRLLKRSLEQVGAVLVTGRAGTGKTSIAANFARQYERKVWYGVEAADADWKIFSNYLSKGIRSDLTGDLEVRDLEVREFVEKLLSEPRGPNTPRLIVLDDIHHVFDTKWFQEFFAATLQTISPAIHLIFLSRSKPSLPLWRLRSKQVLTVIDEKIIAFDEAETAAYCEKAGISPAESAKFYAESFGRIGKLKTLVQAV